jgi:hypothetical protein
MRTTEGGAFLLRRNSMGLPVVPQEAVDGLRSLVEAGTGASDREQVTVQVVACPASRARLRRARKSIREHRSPGIASGLLDLVTPGPSRAARHSNVVEPRWVTEWRRQTQARLAEGTLWSVGVRYAVTTDASRKVARERAGQVASALGAVMGPAWRRKRIRRIERAITSWAAQHGPLMTCAEIAQIAHLPHDAVVPALTRAGARVIAPVPEVRPGGRGTKVLGTAAATGRRVALVAADARFHSHFVGSTGSGKSTLILNAVMADIRDKRAVVLVDPKGDLVRDVMDRLEPEQAAGRLVLIDPDQQPGKRPGLPPIDVTADDEAAEVGIDHFVGICRQIWERHWGPRADDILRQSLRTQIWLRHQGLTGQASKLMGLAGLPTLLGDREARAPFIADLNDKGDLILRGFWQWFDTLSPGIQSQALGPVLARLRTVLGRSFVRDTIGAPEADACFDLGRALDGAGIVLARVPKGQLGEDTSKLMGSVLVARVWQCALERQNRAEHARPDASLYIDEAHNFLNMPQSVNDMLAEARALGLSLTLAHQHMGQLDRDLQFAVSSNARNKVYFTVSPEDARLLSRHTLPNLTEHDLAHAGRYQASARLVADGKELPAFTLATLPPPPAVGKADQVRAMAERFPAFTSGGAS